MLEYATRDRDVATILRSIVDRKLVDADDLDRDRARNDLRSDWEIRRRVARALRNLSEIADDEREALELVIRREKERDADDWRSRRARREVEVIETRIADGASYPRAGIAMAIAPAATNGLGGGVSDDDLDMSGPLIIGGLVCPLNDLATLQTEHRTGKASTVETFHPDCFRRVLDELASGKGRPIPALHGHDLNSPLGSTRTGSLTLGMMPEGLVYRVSLDGGNIDHRNLYRAIARGDVAGSSVGMHVRSDHLSVGGAGVVTREIRDLDVHDISPTCIPAYPKSTCRIIRSAAPAQRSQQRVFPSAVAPAAVPPEVRRAITPPLPRNDALHNRVASLMAKVDAR
jgi:HK97 family phage prohead protease